MSTETRRIQFDFIARDRGVGRQMQETSDQAEDLNEGLEQGQGKMGRLSGAAAKLGPILAGLGAVAATVGPLIAKGLDAQQATAKFKAQLGLTATESKKIGKVAGKLYSQAYGESMDDVRIAITSVVQNFDGMRTATTADLKAVTGRAMTLAEVMEEEVGRVTSAVSQIMRTGLARNSKEAFDIMTKGAQLGANKAQDLADTFEEYSVQFKNMGLTGKQAMGLIVQGLQAGGRNADLVADTIKEFSIEAVAGGERVKKGFANLGLNASQMSAAFAKGGPGAAKALDTILDRLRAIKDPVKRNQVAIELFGTKAEDMGAALYALDPSKATTAMGKFAGATDKAGDALHNTAKAKLTAFKRTIETNVINTAGKALGVLGKLGKQVSVGFNLKGGRKGANDLQELGRGARQVANWFTKDVVPAFRSFGRFIVEEVFPPVRRFHKEVLSAVVKELKKTSKEVKDNRSNFEGFARIAGKVGSFLIKHVMPVLTDLAKIWVRIYGVAIRFVIKIMGWLFKSLEIVWKSFERSKPTLKEWGKTAQSIFRKFSEVAVRVFTGVTRTFLNFVSTLIRGAAKAFGWVPGLGPKLKRAADEVDKFKDKTNRAIDRITKRRNVDIRVKAQGTWAYSKGGGDWQSSYATGGQVVGTVPGATRAYDSQPAILRVDEHVWTPEEVDGAGGHGAIYRLRAMAKKGLLKGYAAGGQVTRGMGLTTTVPSMSPIWRKVAGGMQDMVARLAKELAKMGGGSTAVVRAARQMLGLPYSWGGGGRGGPGYGIGRGAGTFGFDCSGLTEYAWWKGARVGIGGVTYSQHPNSVAIGRPRPGALGFNSSLGHVVLASDRPGYVIEAPFTGAHVREVRKSMPDWRWPKGARFALGGKVQRLGEAATLYGGTAATQMAKLAGIASDPARRRARGGRVLPGQPYLVGEMGAEVMTPGAAGAVHPSGTKVVNVTQHICVEVKVDPTTNVAEVGRKVNESLKEFKRRGGKLVTA